MTIHGVLDALKETAFQYRKRYEVTCDDILRNITNSPSTAFQYRKRYEVTCDYEIHVWGMLIMHVSIPQAV